MPDVASEGCRPATRHRRRPDSGCHVDQGTDAVRKADLDPGVLGDRCARLHHRADELSPAEAFASSKNFYNITRNFAFIGLMSVGMVCVIITGGIDLSVGSVMGLVGVVCGILLQAEYQWYVGDPLRAWAAGVLAGAINGALVAYAGLSSFVVTLGMLSFARSIAIVLSENKMIYEFGPWWPDVQGHRWRTEPRAQSGL